MKRLNLLQLLGIAPAVLTMTPQTPVQKMLQQDVEYLSSFQTKSITGSAMVFRTPTISG